MARLRFLLSVLVLCFLTTAVAQENMTVHDTEPEKTDTSWVYLLNADIMRYDEWINPDAQRLIGNVVFRHDSMYLYCASGLA